MAPEGKSVHLSTVGWKSVLVARQSAASDWTGVTSVMMGSEPYAVLTVALAVEAPKGLGAVVISLRIGMLLVINTSESTGLQRLAVGTKLETQLSPVVVVFNAAGLSVATPPIV